MENIAIIAYLISVYVLIDELKLPIRRILFYGYFR